MHPKVSIVVPVYNVEKYLRQCMESVVRQTLDDIEVICVNDGSTDGSLAILREFEENYSFVKVIDKENGGYGKAMNAGLEASIGDYVGIVESDDFCNRNMFADLYAAAVDNNADAVKSNYFRYISFPAPRDVFNDALGACIYDEVFSPRQETAIFYAAPAIWSGLYNREFLLENDIRFTETPGASFQDTAFNFKVWASAERAVALRSAYLHYRVDNEGSSVKSREKVHYVNYEFAEIERFLDSRPRLKKELTGIKNALKYGTYFWNLNRLSPNLRYEYFQTIVEEFRQAGELGELDEAVFDRNRWRDLNELLEDPDAFYIQKYGQISTDFSIFLEIEDDGLLEETLKSISNQSIECFEVFCMPRIPKPELLQRLHKIRDDDKRIVVLKSMDYLSGALDVNVANGRYAVFMRSGHILEVDALSLIEKSVSRKGELVVDVGGSESTYLKRDLRDSEKVFDLEGMMSDVYGYRLALPAIGGLVDSFKGFPISPYSLSIGTPLLCAEKVKVVRGACSTEKVPSIRSTFERRPPIPPMADYRLYVDDFCKVQEFCMPLVEHKEYRNSFYRFSYASAGWLKRYYKVIPDASVRILEDRYKPSTYLKKTIQTHLPANRQAEYSVSVIIPLHNKVQYVKPCLESVSKQSLRSIEIICVDDGSSDGSLEVALACQAEDSRIVVVEQTNCGPGEARNHALSIARGEYVCFLDADDFYPDEGSLEALYRAAAENAKEICGGTLAIFKDGHGLEAGFEGSQKKYVFKEPCKMLYSEHQYDYGFVRFIYKRSLLESNQINFPDYAWFEDPVFLARALSAAREFYAIPNVVYAYRQTHTAKEIAWSEARVCDLLRGLNDNLKLSKQNGLAELHTETLIRLESDYYEAIRGNMDSMTVFSLLLEANQCLSDDLLLEADVNLDMNHIVRPLASYVQVVEHNELLASRLTKAEKKNKRLERQNKKLRKWTVVRRGIVAIPRYSKKFIDCCRKNGFSEASKKSLTTVQKKIV